MTATNHVLTGFIIASTVHNPLIALPLAFLSHFALDALPHYGELKLKYTSYKFKLILATDIYLALMCFGLVWLLAPAHMWVVIFGGVLAASPDLMWLPDFIAALNGKAKPVYGPIRRFHSKIQWFQKRLGLVTEGAWFIVAFIAAFAFTI